MNNLNIVVKMKFGSHLYGTDTPESDLDYKGVFLPSLREVLLNRTPKSYSNCTKKGNEEKNTSDDVDSEMYSLHYFIKLACEGQTVALDMLHAPEDMIIEKSDIWDLIVSKRHKFYQKNLKAFIGYARKQAAKYGIKGSRLDAVDRVIKFIACCPSEMRLKEVWDRLPTGEHIHFPGLNPNGIPQYQVIGKTFQASEKVGHVLPILKRFYDEYGKRAQAAKENKGIDWKAVSHALRAAYQTRQILKENIITFPLKEASFLKEVKNGEHDYTTLVAPLLESIMDEVEDLTKKSTLPEKVDRLYWDNVLLDILKWKYQFSQKK